MVTITSTVGAKIQFRGYSIRRNDGRGAWLATLQPVTFSLDKGKALVFGTSTVAGHAQECCRLNGYYTTASLRK
jgi:hypothetical protein